MAPTSLTVAEGDYKSPAASSSPAPPPPYHQNKNPKVALKAFLQRAHFDLGFTLNATSPPRRQTPAQLAPLAVKTTAASPPASITIDEAVDEVSSSATSSPLVLASPTPLELPSPQILPSKEHSIPVHLIPLTLRSTSLKSAVGYNDMAGLERSKWASQQAKAKLAQQENPEQPLDASAAPFSQPTCTTSNTSSGSPVQVPVDPSEKPDLGFAGHDEKPVANYSKGFPKVFLHSTIATTGSPHTSTSTEGLLKVEAAERAAKLAKIKENAAPPRAATGHNRIAELMSKRKPSSDFEAKKVKVEPAGGDGKAGLLSAAFAAENLAKAKAEADRVEAARVETERLQAERVEIERVEAHRAEAERLEAERIEAERIEEAGRIEAQRIEAERAEAARLEAERLENERIAKVKAEAERRANIQTEIDAVDTEIYRLEKLEEFRVEEMTAEIHALEAEVREAKECQELLKEDRVQVLKLCELAKNDRDQAQIRVNTLTVKADELKNDVEEATGILTETVKTTQAMQEYDAVNAAKYKQDVTGLLQKKARLEYTLDHPEGPPAPPKVDTSSWPITGYVTPPLGPQSDDAVDVPVVLDDSSVSVETVESTPSPTTYEGPSVEWTAPKDPSLVVVAPKSAIADVHFTRTKREAKDADAIAPSASGHSNSVANGANGHGNGVASSSGTWPKPKPRAPSQVRKVVLHNLPEKEINVTQIMRLVYHGQIHTIDYHMGSKSATIVFLQFADCKKYLDATANGITWPEDPSRIIMVEPCDFESGDQERYDITKAHGMTRCVRMVDIEPDWTSLALRRIAEGTDRQLERMINGHDSKGRRIAEFRFMSIPMAFRFLKEMEKFKEFPDAKAMFVADPCEATGIHSGSSAI